MDDDIDPALRSNGSGSTMPHPQQYRQEMPFDPALMMSMNGHGASNGHGGHPNMGQMPEGYLGYPSSGNGEVDAYGMPSSVSRTGGYTITEGEHPSSGSGGAKRSRSRSTGPAGDDWTQGGQGYLDASSSTPHNRSSRHPDLHSLAAAAASLGAEDGHGEGQSVRSARGKAGRSKVTRASIGGNQPDASSPAGRTRGRGKSQAGGQGAWVTSGIRGGSPDESVTEDDLGGDMSQMGDAGPSSKRRRTGPSSAMDNNESHDRSKEDIKRQKNREKQARLRERRATELEQLQGLAKKQRDEIARLQADNALLQGQLVSVTADRSHKMRAYKGWVCKLEAELSKLGKWSEVASAQTWIKQRYNLDREDMETNGMDTAAPYPEPGSQEYASLRRGHQGATNAHATPQLQQGPGTLGQSNSGSNSSASGRQQPGLSPLQSMSGWSGSPVGYGHSGHGDMRWMNQPAVNLHMQSQPAMYNQGIAQPPYMGPSHPHGSLQDSPPPALNSLADVSWASEVSSEPGNNGPPSLTKSVSASSGSNASPLATPYTEMSHQQMMSNQFDAGFAHRLGNASVDSAVQFATGQHRQMSGQPSASKPTPPSPKMSLDFFVSPISAGMQMEQSASSQEYTASESSKALQPRKRRDSVFNADLSCGDDVVMTGVNYDFGASAESFPVYYDTANVQWKVMQNFSIQQGYYAKKNAELQSLSVASAGEDFGVILSSTPGPVLPDLSIEAAWLLSESDAVEFARRLIFLHPDTDWRPTASSAKFAQAYEIATAQSDKDYGGALGEPLEAADTDANLSWRTRYTPSQRIVLMRALIAIACPPGSKAHYDGLRMSELLSSEREIIENWMMQPDRDRRMDLLPGGIILLNTLVRNRQGPFDSDAFIADLLEEGRLFGNPYEMYAWEPPDHFWYRWRHVLPKAMAFCRSLRPWRRLRTVSINGVDEVVCGATPYQIIMGTDSSHARIPNSFGLPPDDWSADPSAEVSWRNVPKKKAVDFVVMTA